MTDFELTLHDENNYTTSQLSPHLLDFEIQECKTENISRSNSIEDLLTHDQSLGLHIPLPVITIRNPIVLLERCDKIWETLQLIKTIQTEQPVARSDEEGEDKEEKKEEIKEEKEEAEEENEEEEDEEEQEKEEVQLSNNNEFASYVCEPILEKDDNKISLPFKFSIQRTKKLYPCSICSKQYLERRSLRKHSERVHGIIIPLQRRGTKKAIERKINKETSPVVLSNKKENSENLDEKDSFETIIAETKSAKTEVLTKEDIDSNYIECTFCQQYVHNLREHLINYHKIGGSSNIVKLESTLLNKDKSSSSSKTSGHKKTMLKDILSGIPSQKSNENMRDKSHIIDNERDTNQESQTNKKRKYILSHNNKRLKLDNEQCYESVHNTATTVSRRKSINLISYKCDICLGTYASAHGLYKHKRVHRIRGETKENFHNFECRYFNSPLSKKRSTNHTISNVAKHSSNNVNKNLPLNNSECRIKQNKNDDSVTDEADKAKKERSEEKIDKDQLTSPCGKTFQYSHNLFVHKKKCKLCKQENKVEHTAKFNNDKDATIGINITIKKRDDGYQIVNKDNDEEKLQKSVCSKNDISSSNVSENLVKNVNNTVTKKYTQNVSKYSKDHSILKLQIADEDEIIDIEYLQTDSNKSDKTKQEDNEICSLVQQNSYIKSKENETVPSKVSTLKQMCQKVLNDFHTSANAINDVHRKIHKENNQIKNQEVDQENIKAIGQDMKYKNKRKLRSSNRSQKGANKKLSYSYSKKVCATKLDSLACGYCGEQFDTSDSYTNHACSVVEGKSFNEFSLELVCSYCKEILNNYAEFDQHVQLKHFDHTFNCYQCTERFLTDKARLRHFQIVHDMHCRFCNKVLALSLKLLHEGYHLGYGYPCHKCKKAYFNKKRLWYHNYTAHSRANHKHNLITCTICRNLVKVKGFHNHMRYKHNACYLCGKIFSNRIGTEYHIMVHHGTNSKLKCNICGTRFFSRKHLDKHEKMDGCNMRKKRKPSNT